MSENYEYINKVLAKPLDNAQFAACCRQDNTIIAAGAGSGKTQVLATRFAWLVMSCQIKVEEILALTFTKKAASEIYQRIYQILRTFASSEHTPPAEKQCAEEALKNFNKARIQTLDSYCSTVVRQAANKYGVRPDFVVDTLESLKSDALSFVIENKENAALLQFAQPGKLQNLAEEFFVSVTDSFSDVTCEDDFFEKQLEKQKEEIVSVWNFMIKRPPILSESDKIHFADILSKGILSYSDICSFINEEIVSGGESVPELAEYAKDFYNFPEACELLIDDFESALPKTEKMKEVFEKSKGIAGCRKKGVLYAKFFKSGGTFSGGEGLFKNQEPLSAILAPVITYIENYETIRELCVLLDRFMVQTNTKKKKNGVLSFKDVGALALKILKEQEDIRNQEKASIKKIMIDEFQDNNGANRDMLFLLAERDDAFTQWRDGNADDFYRQLLANLSQSKLFFVGDEKQSIYKFRGADVTVFNALEKDLKLSEELANRQDSENLKLYMTNNYRIAKKPDGAGKYEELLAAFNTLFGGTESGTLFEKNGKQAYEAYYSKNATCEDREVTVPLTKENVPIHVSLFDNKLTNQENLPDGKFEDDYLSDAETVAYYTAKKIRALYDAGKGTENSAVKYADFAILCKSRTDYGEIAKYLNFFNVPYSIDQQKKIFGDGPVNDIYNFLRLCVFPQDKKAFAAFLCSSFAGLSLQAVQLLLTVLPQNAANAGLPQNGEAAASDAGQLFKVKYSAFSEDQTKSEEIEKLFAGLCTPDGGAGTDSSVNGEWQKYCQAKAFFEEYKNRALTEPLTAIINELWFKSGYRYETLLNASANLATEQFDFLFELARTCEENGRDIVWFVEQLEEKKQLESFSLGKGEDDELGVKDVSFPVERDDAVEIMTIHKSKGLEFKHVFVLGAMGKAKSESSENVFFDDEFGLSVKLPGTENYFFIRQKNDAHKKAVAELRRLLYVAITRSEMDVYIVDKITRFTFNKDNVTGEIGSVLGGIVKKYYESTLKEPAENGKIYYKAGNPFDLENLEKVEVSVCYGEGGENGKMAETFGALRQKAAAKIERIKQSEPVLVKAEVLRQPRVSPSGFEKLHESLLSSAAGSSGILATGSVAGEKPAPFSSAYEQINSIIKPAKAQNAQNMAQNPENDAPYEADDERTGERIFNHGTFGTMAHAFLEEAIKAIGRNATEYQIPSLPFEVAAQLKKDLSDAEFETLCNVCREMAQSFFTQKGNDGTSLGMQALQSKSSGKFCEAEYAFKLFKDGFFVKGFVDLIFENADGTFTIVDYKTDEKINPALYYEQQAVYRFAAKEILGIADFSKIETKLFYLRYAKIVDITEAVDGVKIDGEMMQKVLELSEES